MQVLGASDSVSGKAVQHRLEMKGSIPPWILDRFTGVIKDAHPAKFQVHHRKIMLRTAFLGAALCMTHEGLQISRTVLHMFYRALHMNES